MQLCQSFCSVACKTVLDVQSLKEISAIKAEARLFLHTCRRLKYANLALLYTFVQSLHEFQLYVIRLVGVMELFAALHLLLLYRLCP